MRRATSQWGRFPGQRAIDVARPVGSSACCKRHRFLEQCAVQRAGILEAAALAGEFRKPTMAVFRRPLRPATENWRIPIGARADTDNPYREPVPGFQVLHALIAFPTAARPVRRGSPSAENLRTTASDAFSVLTRTPVPFVTAPKMRKLYAAAAADSFPVPAK